jgi:tetratricopeptide (TPR) repeat protein
MLPSILDYATLSLHFVTPTDQRALELAPNASYSLLGLGKLQYDLEAYADSAESFQKALEFQTENLILASNLGYLYLLQGDIDKARNFIEPLMNDESFDRLWINFGLLESQRGALKEAMKSWQKGLDLMCDTSDWKKAVRYVFTIAMGHQIEGLENMRQLIDYGTDRFTLRNALNDATILSRCPQPIPGIDEMIQLLEEALAKFEPIASTAFSPN